METQTQILGKELSDKEFVTLSKEQLRYLINHYEVINDNTPRINITYGVSLYKITSDHYLLVDGEYHHNLLIKDEKGEIWNFIKTKMTLLKREAKETLKKHSIIVENEIELYPSENWYSFIYPNSHTIWNSNGVVSKEYDNFHFYGKHFDVIIIKYTNNALWIKIYSPSLMLQIAKEFIYDYYKEK